jgi:membrane fusion protein (multidrug efflux system)
MTAETISRPGLPPRRALRYGVVAIGLVLLVGGLGLIKILQISLLKRHGQRMQELGPPPEAVGTALAQEQTWELVSRTVGTVQGINSVILSSEVPGTVTRILFSSGRTVEKGDLLLELDAAVERAQLASAKAKRDLAEVTAKRSRQLVRQGAAAQAQLDADEAQLKSSTTDVAALEAAVDKKMIRAPFAGRLGVREVSVGQYLSPGARITFLNAIGDVLVDFSLPQGERPQLQPGQTVRIHSRFSGTRSGEWTTDGKVVAVEPVVDENTRTVKLRARVADPKQLLRPGVFVDVQLISPETARVLAVPATAIVHAAYGDSVFVVEDKPPESPGLRQTPTGQVVRVAHQKFVRVGPARGDYVGITEGLSAADEVVSIGAFKLRNGAPVIVDNRVQPNPSLTPTPKNR